MGDDIYLFSYSYWNPEEISKVLKVDVETLIPKIKAGYVEGYERVFGGSSDIWEGTSIPTMVTAEDKITYGFCIALSELEYS